MFNNILPYVSACDTNASCFRLHLPVKKTRSFIHKGVILPDKLPADTLRARRFHDHDSTTMSLYKSQILVVSTIAVGLMQLAGTAREGRVTTTNVFY